MPDLAPNQFDISKLPWWGQLFYLVGLPSALVVFLTWFITGGMYDKVNAIEDNQNRLIKAQELHNVDTSWLIKETISMRLVLQQICINSAISSGQKTYECFKQQQ